MTKSGKNRLLFVGVGILLVVLAVRSTALQIAGKSAQATVTKVEQAIGQQNDKMEHNYQISYRFSVNGKDYTGGLTRKRVYNATALPNVGGMVTIRYLPSVPAINGGTDEGILGGLVFVVLGIGLLVLGVKPRKPANQAVPQGDAHADTQS